VRVWGTAGTGREVVVEFGGRSVRGRADEGGRFEVRLPAMEGSAKAGELVAREEGGDEERLEDVVVGDVWVCSGQSNMEWPLWKAATGPADAVAAKDSLIRAFVVPRKVRERETTEVRGEWVAGYPEAMAGFSAVGYYFAQEIRKDQRVPVGLVGAYWGATPAEAWTPRGDLAGEVLGPIAGRHEKLVREGKPQARGFQEPGVLWNGMVRPLVPMSVRGVLWYQGENNASRAEQYGVLFPAMIRAWRREFGQEGMPFLFVQLANYRERKGTPGESEWAELREAQDEALKLPGVGRAVAIDNADPENPNNIHPHDKRTVGHRLALAARGMVYGEDVVWRGPTFEGMEADGGTVRVRFGNVGGGLVAKGGGRVKGFAVAGEDRKFVFVDGVIEGDSVVLTTPLPRVAAVRYGWADNPEVNLYNAAGLPAGPFRTDEWPGVTAGRR
jgi:sialate O-acetylesterase